MMKTELAYFDVYPKIVRAKGESGVTIAPRGDQAAFREGRVYRVTVVPLNRTRLNSPEASYGVYELVPQDGSLRITHGFGGEGRYALLVEPGEVETPGPGRRTPASLTPQKFYVYAAEDDLFRLRPWRGDLHVHSIRSDGREEPAVVAAAYRRAGFDFLAITDHRLYEPSLEAIAAYKDAPIDLRLFPGEEIHPPADNTHYIHFGGAYSINSIFRNDGGRYEREIAELAKTLNLPSGIDPVKYASCLWVCAEIKKAGGLSIMVHPHWIQENAYHIREDMCIYMLNNAPFDAFELIGGQNQQENQMQTSLWQQLRAEGRNIPVVGSSDSHGAEISGGWFGIAKTIVLSERCDKDGIFEAIRRRQSVALEQYHEETFPRLYGEYRYTAFALFLLEEYFPLHDELCIEEGRLMKEYALGDREAASGLARLSGRSAALMKKCWEDLWG